MQCSLSRDVAEKKDSKNKKTSYSLKHDLFYLIIANRRRLMSIEIGDEVKVSKFTPSIKSGGNVPTAFSSGSKYVF